MKKPIPQNPPSASRDRVAEQISGVILSVHRKAAGYLNKNAQSLPPSASRWGLLLYCLLYGGTCLYLLLRAIPN
ncbi:hypothetical protein [Rufibacter sp. LB8]|uniref:hypothetical protein n=1 Tax=Rufibacter sp. LB8 TaxID=2777781 RepID=UPI00178C3245|nr:hypothetical protein [Rufibacter sp. LB8]